MAHSNYTFSLASSIFRSSANFRGNTLKEVDAAALAVTETPAQVVDILRYVIRGELDGY
jgi:hypothetical protein